MVENIRRCTRCVSGSDIPGIQFDENGVCNYCKMHDRMDKKYPLNEIGKKKLDKLILDIKNKGTNKKFDCVVGISGGTDSIFTLYKAVEFGLRPLAVHFDNGWNSEIAENNIKYSCNILNVPLRRVSVDWEEYRNLQIEFLKASVPEAEIPTDIGAFASQYKIANEEGLKYILNGHSFRMEGVAPLAWSNIDGRYIIDVHKKYGNKELKTFPNLTLLDIINYTLFKGIKVIHILDYIKYNKKDVKELLKKELNWVDYGAHHYESIYTKWVANNLLPGKFKIDKRPIEYSAFIRSNQMSRNEALLLLTEPINYDNSLDELVKEKLQIENIKFKEILNTEIKSFKNYNTYYPLYKKSIIFMKLFTKIGLLGDLGETFIEKYSTY